MEHINQNNERYYSAKKQVEEIKGFYGNLISYIVVNVGLVIVNLMTSPNHLWFYWPLLWWGMGVVFHGLRAFKYMPFITKDWEEKKIREYMEEEQGNKETWE
jgi:hypothetical protein